MASEKASSMKHVHLMTLFLVVIANVILVVYVLNTYYTYSCQLLKQDDVATQRTEFPHRASPGVDKTHCHMETCFDFSRCALDSGFPVYVYRLENSPGSDKALESSVLNHDGIKRYVTDNPAAACVFVVLFGEEEQSPIARDQLGKLLHSLPHWKKDGTNHILVRLTRDQGARDYFAGVDTGRAVLVQSAFNSRSFRGGYDVIVPPPVQQNTQETSSLLPPLFHASHRQYFLSFLGQYVPSSRSGEDRMTQVQREVVASLKNLQSKARGLVTLQMACDASNTQGVETEWGLCLDSNRRGQILLNSTFALLISPLDSSLCSTVSFQTRVSEALRHGAVPVVLGAKPLPFSEMVHWDDAVLTLPLPRIRELLFFLGAFGDQDVARMRLQGRFLWTTYFSSAQRVVETALALVRFRLQIPPLPAREEPSVSVFTNGSAPRELHLEAEGTQPGSRMASERYQRNFTRSLQRTLFNTPGDPFSLFPSTPYEPALPSEAKFWEDWGAVRAINQSSSSSSRHFSTILQGNLPEEQFTVVIMSYKRESSLMACLQRLKGVAYLNKVIVVWNHPSPPSPHLTWTNPGVPVEVLKQTRNSLNNHLLPFQSIDTDCVLTLDDDIVLSHHSLLLGFRIWREERDRVVGFFGRYHWWKRNESSWQYSWNLPHELSFVMPSSAFIHKYYLYMYSYVMPQAVRDHVDEHMNGEDIALNFIVAHISRKAPRMVTSHFKQYCPGCPKGLSSRSEHLAQRHECINVFSKIFGYTPLLFTDYIADKLID